MIRFDWWSAVIPLTKVMRLNWDLGPWTASARNSLRLHHTPLPPYLRLAFLLAERLRLGLQDVIYQLSDPTKGVPSVRTRHSHIKPRNKPQEKLSPLSLFFFPLSLSLLHSLLYLHSPSLSEHNLCNSKHLFHSLHEERKSTAVLRQSSPRWKIISKL